MVDSSGSRSFPMWPTLQPSDGRPQVVPLFSLRRGKPFEGRDGKAPACRGLLLERQIEHVGIDDGRLSWA